MASSNPDIAMFESLGRQDPSLKWYGIADTAQHRALPAALAQDGYAMRCLFGASPNSPVAKKSPHLTELCSPVHGSRAWNWIRLHARSKPCLTVLATTLSFDTLFRQLAECTEVVLPDEFAMFFGFWDPAILGTLMGQSDDLTLHVKGPVLSSQQQSMLTRGLAAWWYWDRAGEMHSLAIDRVKHVEPATQITLTQEQVDDLVETSVPDHVLYYLELNQPRLIADVPSMQRYELVRAALGDARDIGLLVMRDLVNYVCMELIYKERIRSDPVILKIFEQVRRGRLTFGDALKALP